MRTVSRVSASKCWLTVSGALALWGLWAQVGNAQAYKQGDKVLDVQLFHPAPVADDLLGVRGPSVLQHGEVALAAYVTYLRMPLSVPGAGDERFAVENQVSWEFDVSFGLWDRLLIGLGLPFSLVQDCAGSSEGGPCAGVSALSGANFEGGGFGDLRLALRGVILRPRQTKGFGLGVAATMTFPTGDATAFVGEGNLHDLNDPNSGRGFYPTGTFSLLAGYQLGQVRLAADVGYLTRGDRQFVLLTVADQFLYGVGAAYAPLDWLEVLGEFSGRLTVTDANMRNNPHELRLAARFRIRSLKIDLGFGVGLAGDYGAPDFRLITGISYIVRLTGRDADRDGVVDSKDACIEYAEDKDGHEDTDGCPDLDDDDDGIPDAIDRCPTVPAVTGSGCPQKGS